MGDGGRIDVIVALTDGEALSAYVDCGKSSEAAGRILGVSGRTVRFRLARIRGLITYVWKRKRIKKATDMALLRAFRKTKSLRGAGRAVGISYAAARTRLRKLTDLALDCPRIKGRDWHDRFKSGRIL
jgi:hypothetical protein